MYGCDDFKYVSSGGRSTFKTHESVQREGVPKIDETERKYFLKGPYKALIWNGFQAQGKMIFLKRLLLYSPVRHICG